MPNWCANRLEIFGPAALVADVRAAVASEELAFDFERIVPTPPELLKPDGDPVADAVANPLMPDWLGWRIANWGTKWNAADPSLVELPAPGGRSCVRYDFSTAWSPPMPILDLLASRYPALGVAIFFSDEQMNFIGHARWANGRQITGEMIEEESEQDAFGRRLFGDEAAPPSEASPRALATIQEPAPRWEQLLDSERVFLSDHLTDAPTIRLRVEADGRAARLRDGAWHEEKLPSELVIQLRRIASRKGEAVLPIEVELCEVARADAPGRTAVPGLAVTRLLLDLYEFGGQPLNALPYAERRQLRADLAARLVTPRGTCWFDLADPRLVDWRDERGEPVMGDHFETPLGAALPSGRRLVA